MTTTKQTRATGQCGGCLAMMRTLADGTIPHHEYSPPLLAIVRTLDGPDASAVCAGSYRPPQLDPR